ncbi:MAG TPA: methyltransferase domain-containing protein [Ideonella sp.]|uniref:methyltransferase domain-containing protein n=1 Tax=Ideonella sp. TaxID=1929293 RepID=UPI002BCDE5C7|nr:methyltransferase domain-containing protein [Ideonella sp.]HSI48368.1 methyltransferase domain-containing protein [Ideonella sp.]
MSASSSRLDPAALRRVMQRRLQAGQMPWLHQEVARRMAERLSLILRTPAQVLDWSLDAGAPSEALAAANPEATISVVDAAASDAAATPPRPGWWARLRGASAAMPRVAPGAVPSESADLLWSNMLLHHEAEPPQTLRAWRQALKPDGFVMFSTIGPGSLAKLREVYAAAGWPLPHAPFVDMHDVGDMMVEAGFADPVMDQEVLTLTYADPVRLLEELREWGGNTAPQRLAGLRTPRWRERLLAALRARAGADGRIALELELVYGHAFRAPDRGPQVAAETSVGLDAMKLMLRKSGGRK